MDAQFLVCVDCGVRFEFPAEERERFESRQFAPPKRCKACRAAKRRRAAGKDALVVLADTTGAPYAAKPPRDAKPTHPTVCTICGAATAVPFVPDGIRPVYCLPCLKQRTR